MLILVDLEDHPHLDTVRELFEEYQAELGVDLCFQSFAEELRDLPGKYGPPNGKLYLVEIEGRAAACGALRDLGDAIAEIKRLYVRPEFRRIGMGRDLSVRLMEDAASLGYRRVRLDTLARLEGAIALYKQLGFQQIEPYNYNPEPDIVYMERAVKA